jgi:probable DNA repair protein
VRFAAWDTAGNGAATQPIHLRQTRYDRECEEIFFACYSLVSIAAQPVPPLSRDEALEAARAGATLVTGDDRLARVLREAFNAKLIDEGAAAWLSPQIHSWSVWIDRLWQDLQYRSTLPLPLRLTADQERLLWEQAIARDRRQSPLLAVSATAEAARQAAKLAVEWRLEGAAIEACDSEEVRSFLRWRREVYQRLEERGFLDGARVADALIERSREIGGGVVLLAGFDVLTPQQQELFEALRAADGAVREVSLDARENGNRRRVELDGRRDELRAAALWAKGLVDSSAAGKIAVVVPGLGERRREVERVFLEVFDAPALLLSDSPAPGFVVSAGVPLDRHPLVRSALLALELHPAATDPATFSAWLRSDAVAGGAAERNGRGLLDRALRDKGVPVVRPAELGKLLDDTPQLKPALRRWAARYRRTAPLESPAEWSARFSHLLEALGWPGEGPETAEGLRALLAWNELLGAFASLSATAGQWDFATARGALAQMAQATAFRPPAEDARVEIMSLSDSAGAEADHLWIVGLDDETWPDEPRPNPFLPVGQQRERGLPHASPDRELRFARQETARLLARAPDVIVSHARSVEDRTLGPSPLVADLPLVALEQLVGAWPPRVVQTVRAAARLERVADAGLPLADGAEAPGGVKIFEFQAHCPFRAFAELRLGAKGLEEVAAGLSYGDRGNLAHWALESLWKDLQGSDELHNRGEEGLRRAVAEAVTYALAALAERRRAALPPGLAAVERARLEELLAGWLEIERNHRREPFRVIAIEEKYVVEAGGVSAKVRVDRIDELPDGRRVILDYKTGAMVDHEEWDRERPMQPQLPLYAVHHAESLAAVLFARLRVLESGFLGAVAPGVAIEGAEMDRAAEFEERVGQWRANLEALAADFLAGRAEIDPRDGNCGHCKLPALCRKDDVHAAG